MSSKLAVFLCSRLGVLPRQHQRRCLLQEMGTITTGQCTESERPWSTQSGIEGLHQTPVHVAQGTLQRRRRQRLWASVGWRTPRPEDLLDTAGLAKHRPSMREQPGSTGPAPTLALALKLSPTYNHLQRKNHSQRPSSKWPTQNEPFFNLTSLLLLYFYISVSDFVYLWDACVYVCVCIYMCFLYFFLLLIPFLLRWRGFGVNRGKGSHSPNMLYKKIIFNNKKKKKTQLK